ncbi:SagB family peptide dehydrogenase [Arachnia propionica]|uniref:SagB family peptide dehydrogenase n=1 Tax=Arachnia propionica TaxID=1750 RepID=UPI000F6EB1E8|nr:SagB family peptide dehydrogenase [Arachnia propionica]VEJ57310.1 SagB-type dehydrogenase domain [Arachnia propionica]
MQKMLAADGVSFVLDGDNLVIIDGRGEHRALLGEEIARRIACLAERPCVIDELTAGLLTARDGMRKLALLTTSVRDLTSLGLIDQVVEFKGTVIARLTKKGRLPWRDGEVPDNAVVSRHVVATHDDRWVLLDSGLGCGLVKVDASIAGYVLTGKDMGLKEQLSPVRELMWRAGLLVPASSEETMEQTMWDPVDLLMVERSSDSAASSRYGGTYRYCDTHPAPLLIEAIRTDEVVEIPEPDPERWFCEDEPFGVITERRRSSSSFQQNAAPRLDQLVNVLHRSARIQRRFRDDHGIEVSFRPAAGGGALHELDLYIVIDRVDGLDQGLWRYNPTNNTLEHVHCLADPVVLVEEAAGSVWNHTKPPVTIILVARFARVLWKYEGVGAALVLKDAGVLTHALQLAAIAEGLGACALGSNFAHVFEQVTGLGFPTHGPVGQLVLGVPKEE